VRKPESTLLKTVLSDQPVATEGAFWTGARSMISVSGLNDNLETSCSSDGVRVKALLTGLGSGASLFAIGACGRDLDLENFLLNLPIILKTKGRRAAGDACYRCFEYLALCQKRGRANNVHMFIIAPNLRDDSYRASPVPLRNNHKGDAMLEERF
jgi:hypothetical protein